MSTVSERRTGRTSKQIQAAPHGAVFVWVNHRTHYLRDLARHLGRADLRIEYQARTGLHKDLNNRQDSWIGEQIWGHNHSASARRLQDLHPCVKKPALVCRFWWEKCVVTECLSLHTDVNGLRNVFYQVLARAPIRRSDSV